MFYSYIWERIQDKRKYTDTVQRFIHGVPSVQMWLEIMEIHHAVYSLLDEAIFPM